MDAIKKVLSPGKHKDDEVMYGQGSSAPVEKDAGEGRFNTGVPTGENAPDLYTLPKERQESHGVLRQVLNPGGEKYSDIAYGSTATTNANAPGAVEHSSSQEKPPKEHGILRQIFNPNSDKYDADNFRASDDAYAPKAGQPVPGALAQGSEARKIESTDAADNNNGVLNQIINPGGHRYDETRLEPTGNVATGSSTAKPAHESHVGRDAALGAGVGAVAYEASKQHHLTGDYDKNTQSGLLGTTSGTSSGLAGTSTSTAAPLTSAAPSQSGLTSTAAAPQHGQDTELSHHVYNGIAAPPPTKSGHVHDFGATKTHIIGVTEGIPPAEPVSQPHGPSFNIPSAEQEPGTSAKVYNTVTGKHSGHEYDIPQHGSSEAAKDAALGTATVGATSTLPEYSSTPAPSTSAPSTSATTSIPATTSHSNTGPTGGTAAAALAAQEAARRHQTQQAGFAASNTTSQPQHNYGRDAAVAGGVAAAGAGTYEAGNHADSGPASKTIGPHSSNIANVLDPRVKPDPALQKSSGGDATGPASNTIGPHSSNIANVLDPRVKPQPELQGATRHSERETAAGAMTSGAAGVGAYETREHADTGPASKTIGPHESNVANVLDPRVKPQPELQKEHTTTGSNQADVLNETGPRADHTADQATSAAPATTTTTGSAPSEIDKVIEEGHEVDKKHRGPQFREDEQGRNKLHKEKKEGFLHKLLHPHKKEDESEETTEGKTS